MKRWMLANVLLLSTLTIGLVACGDDEDKEKSPPCETTLTVTCEGKCGSVVDACGATQDCGTDCGAGKACNTETNVCEDSCVVDEAKACEGKCGAITAKDSCGADVPIDCGSECGEGKQCNEKTHACAANVEDECLFNSDCADDEICDSTNCVDFYCYCAVGTRGTKACGEAIEVDPNECASGMGIGEGDNHVCGCACSDTEPCPTEPELTCYYGMCLI